MNVLALYQTAWEPIYLSRVCPTWGPSGTRFCLAALVSYVFHYAWRDILTRTFALASPQLPHMTNERLSISQNYRQNLWTGHTVSRVFQNIFCTSRVLKFSPRKVKFFTHFSARTTVHLVFLRIQTLNFRFSCISCIQWGILGVYREGNSLFLVW